VDERLDQVAKRLRDKPRTKAKELELRNFLAFIEEVGQPVDGPFSDLQVRRFMAMRDMQGHTTVHKQTCRRIGTSDARCGCPHNRMRPSSLKGIMLALRNALTTEAGYPATRYDAQAKTGSPAFSSSADTYLRMVIEEQAEASVPVKRAVLLLPDQLAALVRALVAAASEEGLALAERMQCHQDIAWLVLAHHATSRSGQLGSLLTRTANIRRCCWASPGAKLCAQDPRTSPESSARVIRQSCPAQYIG
jgi:hypothetical protein